MRRPRNHLTDNSFGLHVDIVYVPDIVSICLVVFSHRTQGAYRHITALRITVKTKRLVLVLWYWTRPFMVKLIQGGAVGIQNGRHDIAIISIQNNSNEHVSVEPFNSLPDDKILDWSKLKQL